MPRQAKVVFDYNRRWKKDRKLTRVPVEYNPLGPLENFLALETVIEMQKLQEKLSTEETLSQMKTCTVFTALVDCFGETRKTIIFKDPIGLYHELIMDNYKPEFSQIFLNNIIKIIDVITVREQIGGGGRYEKKRHPRQIGPY